MPVCPAPSPWFVCAGFSLSLLPVLSAEQRQHRPDLPVEEGQHQLDLPVEEGQHQLDLPVEEGQHQLDLPVGEGQHQQLRPDSFAQRCRKVQDGDELLSRLCKP